MTRRLLTLVALAAVFSGCSDDDDERKQVNELCVNSQDCADEVCHRDRCVPLNPKPNGATCSADAWCASFVCMGGVCAPGTAADGALCRLNAECLSDSCVEGKCTSKGKPTSAACSDNAECASGICHKTICVSDSPGKNGRSCKGDGDCLSLDCQANICVAGSSPGGSSCINHEECASGSCTGGMCESGGQPDAGPSDVGLPDAADAGPPDVGPPDVGPPDVGLPDATDAGSDAADGALPDAALPEVGPDGPKPKCGDDVVNQSFELCDGANLGGKTCKDFGYANVGALQCKPDCLGYDLLYCYTLDQTGFSLASGTNSETRPVMATDGTNWLVVYTDNTNVRAKLVDDTGKVIGSTVNLGGKTNHHPSVVYVPSEKKYWVAWYSTVIEGRKVNPNGALEPTMLPYVQSQWAGMNPDIAHNGTQLFVTWDRGSHIYGTRVTSAGIALDTATGGIAISAASTERDPSIASDGKGWFVTWRDYRNGKSHIYGARIDSTGTVKNPTGIPISKSVGNNHHSPAAVIYDGTDYVVAWTMESTLWDHKIWGARVGPTTGLVTTFLARNQVFEGVTTQDSLSFDGSFYVIAWTTRPWSTACAPCKSDVEILRLKRSDLKPGSPQLVLSPATNAQFDPALAYGKGHHLVVWTDERNTTTKKMDIYGSLFK